MEYALGFLTVVILAAVVTGLAVMGKATGESGEFTYLLVLGTKVIGNKPGKMLTDRINGAYQYLKIHENVICIVSGYQSGLGDISEAECMKRELVRLGIEEHRIWLEPNAGSTKENLSFTMKLIWEKSGKRPEILGILSSEHHLFRAKLLAKRQRINCVMLPAKTTDRKTFIVNFLREIPLIWYYSVAG